MDPAIIKKTKEFVKKSFIEKPHYSFDQWSVMYNHSVLVQKIALKVTKNVKSDETIVALSALLHDIGKIYKADSKRLLKVHKKLNIIVCEKFLDSLGLPKNKLKKIKDIISYKSDSIEMKIIKDADTLALYADKRLYTLYIKWAVKEKLFLEIERKMNKFNNLNFDISKRIGEKWFKQMKKDWNEYRKKH